MSEDTITLIWSLVAGTLLGNILGAVIYFCVYDQEVIELIRRIP